MTISNARWTRACRSLTAAIALLLLLPSLALAQARNFTAGDSISDRTYLSGTNYADWFSQERREVSVILAKGGSCAADQMAAIYANPPNHANGDASLFLLGANDLGPTPGTGRGYGAGALALYAGTMQSHIYFAGGITKTARDPSIGYTGSWGYNASIGTYSSTPGSTMTVHFTGDVFALSYLVVDGLSGIFSVAIDGIPKGTFSTIPPAVVNTWYFHQTYASALQRFAGNGAGSHTFVLTLTSGYALPEYAWFGSSGVPTYVLTVLRMRAPAVGPDAGVAAYNNELTNAVAMAATDGMNAHLIDSSAAVDPRFDLSSDGIHPIERTHRKIMPLQPF